MLSHHLSELAERGKGALPTIPAVKRPSMPDVRMPSVPDVKGCDPIPEPGKIDHIRFGCEGGVPEDSKYIHTLKKELANSYYWSGNPFRDYFFFVANWHPLLGLFISHPNHPWTKKARLVQLIISAEIVMVPSALIGRHFEGDPAGEFPVILMCVTVPDLLIGVILYQASISGTRCPRCHRCLLWMTRAMFCYALIYGFTSMVLCYLILSLGTDEGADWETMIRSLATGMITGWVTWFPIWLLLPCQLGFLSLWRAEKNEQQGSSGDGSARATTVGATSA